MVSWSLPARRVCTVLHQPRQSVINQMCRAFSSWRLLNCTAHCLRNALFLFLFTWGLLCFTHISTRFCEFMVWCHTQTVLVVVRENFYSIQEDKPWVINCVMNTTCVSMCNPFLQSSRHHFSSKHILDGPLVAEFRTGACIISLKNFTAVAIYVFWNS